MKGARFLIPATLAILVVALLLALLWSNRNAAIRAFHIQAKPGTWVASLQNLGTDLGNEGDTSMGHIRKGDVAALAGDWKEAEDEYAAAVDTDGGAAALKKLAHTQLQRGETDKARSTIDRLRKEEGRAEEVLLLAVTLALHDSDTAQATSLLDAAGDSPHKRYAAALLAIAQSDQKNAQTELTATIEGWEPTLRAAARTLQDAYDEYALYPQSNEIHLSALLGRALAQVQECPIALPLLQRVTAAKDDYRDAWIVQGYCQLVTEKTDEALASLERAYTIDPRKPEIQYFLGRTYAAKNDHTNAVTYYQYALQNGFQPERDVRRELAKEAQASGDLLLAFSQEKYLATSSGADLATIRGFVDLALKAQRPEDAYDVALKATTLWPQDARAYDLYGTAAAAADKKNEARAAFQKALELDGSLDDVKAKLLKL